MSLPASTYLEGPGDHPHENDDDRRDDEDDGQERDADDHVAVGGLHLPHDGLLDRLPAGEGDAALEKGCGRSRGRFGLSFARHFFHWGTSEPPDFEDKVTALFKLRNRGAPDFEDKITAFFKQE